MEQMKLPLGGIPTGAKAKQRVPNDPLSVRWPKEAWWLEEGALHPAHVTRYLQRLSILSEAEYPAFGIDPAEWIQIGRSEYELDAGSRRKIQDICHKLYFKNPFARNIINNLTFYTLGKQGVKVDWKDDEIAERRWSILKKRNRWSVLSKDIGKLTFLCGETFVPLFPLEKELKLDIRLIHPTEIEKIETKPSDMMTPLSYIRRLPSSGQTVSYGPQDMVHFKLYDVGPVKHGRPVLEPAVEPLMIYDEWLHTRNDLTRMRSRMPIIRYVKGEVDVPPILALPEAGSVITANMDREEWQYPSLNLGSDDAAKEGREIKLYIAAAVSLPEYMVSQDASNANYASTAVVEATPLAMFKDYQGIFRDYFEELVYKLMPHEAKRIEPIISFPDVDLRNFNEKVKSVISEFEAGLRSRRTAQLELDMDPEEERRWMAEELMPLESDPRFRRLVEAALFHWPAIKEFGGNGNSTVERLLEALEKRGIVK